MKNCRLHNMAWLYCSMLDYCLAAVRNMIFSFDSLKRCFLTILNPFTCLNPSGVAWLSAVQGRPQKCRPFHLSNLLTKNWNERSSLCLFNDIRINPLINYLENHNQTQTEMNLSFHCWLWILLFLLVDTFLIINFSVFCFLYICIYEPDMFRQNIFPVGS